MYFKKILLTLVCLILSFPFSASGNERLTGGAHTHNKSANRFTFSHPSPKLSIEEELDFKIGKAVFEKIWVFAPSSTTASDGLGPLYNARSCSRCHKGNGRGVIEGGHSSSPALFLKLSIPPSNHQQETLLASGKLGFIPEPVYGKQLQTFAYPGGNAEGQLEVNYAAIKINLNDNETIELQKPEYKISHLGYGPIAQDFMFSPRIAPALIGLGLLEAIDKHDILALSDPQDLNKDGISGKANVVWDETDETLKLGRFGWKAGSPTLEQQNNAALNGDIGISSWQFPQHAGDCTTLQQKCKNQAHGNRRRDKPKQDMLEASKVMTDLLLHYTRNIALPAARNINNENRNKGKELFHAAGCQHCHQPRFVTTNKTEQANLAKQTIWPYTDLLLHDMGEDLADNRPEFQANGQEWRTPPLWGVGLTEAVSGKSFFLHDGRARNLLEAILWHGGEAKNAQQAVINMSTKQRQQLISFLESL